LAEAVQAGLFSNPIEFDGIKNGIVELLPDAEKLDGVAIAQPVGNEVVGPLGVFEAGDVREADEILLVLRKNSDNRSLHFDGDSGCFSHASRRLLVQACFEFADGGEAGVRVEEGLPHAFCVMNVLE
jgi:hypothetical protein